MSGQQNQIDAVLKSYLSANHILIVDTSKMSRDALFRALCELGAAALRVIRAESYEEAIATIKSQKPKIVLSEYDIGKRTGLELMQTIREEMPESKDSLFILVTGNASQSTVAQAAEEDVDTFVLKPFSATSLKQTLLRAVVAKLTPSDYLKTIEAGKKLLFEQKFDEASALFKQAEGMDSKPVLAHFYMGQVELMKSLFNEAAGSYKKGLNLNKIHYKCLVGLHDLLMKQKQYDEAYDIVKKISRYFPANPKRLAGVLRLAIMTKNYEDIERYYQMFINIDQREEELIKYVCAALVVCGKYYLKTNYHNRGFELFNKAAVSAAGRTNFIKEIVLSLCEYGFHKEGMTYLKRFPSETQGQCDYLALQYLLQDADQNHVAPKLIQIGQELLKSENHDPLIYKILIKRMKEVSQTDPAENLFAEAVKRYPNQKPAFERALKGTLTNVVTGT